MDFGNSTSTPLQRKLPLYQQAYQAIKKAILSGQIKPGTKINESALAEQYQISRTPLREAIRQLQNEGLLVSNKSITTVVKMDKKDFKELCHCRLILEKEIIKLVIEQINNETINEIEKLLKKTEFLFQESKKIDDYIEILHHNAQFHELLIKSCGNKRLVQLGEQVRSLLLLYRANALMKVDGYNDFQQIIQEHTAIFEAVKNKDIEKAIVATEAHLQGDMRRGEIFED